MKKEFGMNFLVYSQDEHEKYQKGRPTLRDWSASKRDYITKFNNSQLLNARNRVFVIEMDSYKVERESDVQNVRIVVRTICY